MTLSLMCIGQVATRVGLSTHTIRLYEKMKIISSPLRSSNGYRHYRAQDIEQLCFIKQAKKMGFTLKEIQGLIQIQQGHHHDCEQVKRCAEKKLAHVIHKQNELKRLKRSLERLIQECHEKGDAKHCPFLDVTRPNKSEK